MAKKAKSQNIDFPFYFYLHGFYNQNKGKIRSHYRQISRSFLDFNNPEKGIAYLRPPQYEALEMYIFLKEFLDNQSLHEIFKAWFEKTGKFEGRQTTGVNRKTGQTSIFGPLEANSETDVATFDHVFKQIESFKQIYPNYIFALTMGIGKTVLMATCIFYEFILANKFPKDEKYCHNALVFAPDKTVLQSLKEMESFDRSKVVPPEYVNFCTLDVHFQFLDESGDALNTLRGSKFNIVVSNTQKIILKREHKERKAVDTLFGADTSKYYQPTKTNDGFDDLVTEMVTEGLLDESSLLLNQRFQKLLSLEQLGIYVDEAHHVFGNALAKDFLPDKTTSLRNTINAVAKELKANGSRVVGCYNYTGTPYVGARLLPEVVYSYGLKDAIDNKYLKRVEVFVFSNIQNKTKSFISQVIKEFWAAHEGKRYEGMLPKLAFFGATIDEINKEVRPAVEAALVELEIPISKILVNTGDSSNDEVREFRNLDTLSSEKQFILLVNKGKEGWNCRSLFGVGLYREPKSRVFTLQATMRCLRSIGDVQEIARVWLSEENKQMLEDELQENFKISLEDLQGSGDTTPSHEVRLVPPPVKIKLMQVRKLFQLKEKPRDKTIHLKLAEVDKDKYKIIRTQYDIHDMSKKKNTEKDYSRLMTSDKRTFSELTLVAEIARYLNIKCLEIRSILQNTEEGIAEILRGVNEYNELLYDHIVPKLFSELYDMREYEDKTEIEIDLVKPPKNGDFYKVKAETDKVLNMADPDLALYKDKSFHLDNYCFDSNPELNFFWSLLKEETTEKVWFTGMLTHGQTDFKINYIDPESHQVRSYYPDFLVQQTDGTYVIYEIKADYQIDNTVVQAKKAYAEQIASASRMRYEMVLSSGYS